ncbi:MAG: hypothetical protein JW984_13405 [Deltaproteobacteria bacterium]|uniref:Uncharacterized protein n=1 Tax=Candidatus Zymogenus saltonus TaxID=2844893 RepID=A0A9D8PQR2_9DELT|nr:hypothetical protein [Candidatus Zymogenus saltonus]
MQQSGFLQRLWSKRRGAASSEAGEATRFTPYRPRYHIGLCAALLLTSIFAVSCTPPKEKVLNPFSAVPMRKYQSIEYSNLIRAKTLLGLNEVRHSSPMRDKIAFFSEVDSFIFSMGEMSFLLSENASLGFDPSGFATKIVARTDAHSVMVVTGDFDRKAITKRLIEYHYRAEDYRGHTLYSLPLTNALMMGGLPLTFSNLTFVNRNTIAHAPTIDLLKDYIDGFDNGILSGDKEISTIVEEAGDVTSLYISSAVTATELYGENSLMSRSPDEWGLPDYHLSPYTYFAFGIRPAETGKEQDIILVIYYPDEESAERDEDLLKDGLRRGRGLSGLTPFSELFSVRHISAKGNILKAHLKTKEGFDIKLLIRLRDLPFLVCRK